MMFSHVCILVQVSYQCDIAAVVFNNIPRYVKVTLSSRKSVDINVKIDNILDIKCYREIRIEL